MASVYKRGKVWWIRYSRNGHEVRKSARTRIKATAVQYLAEQLEEVGRITRGGQPRRTYREALERFSRDYLPTLKPKTQARYRISLKQMHSVLSGLYLDQITRTVLADYVNHRRQGRVTDATIRRDLATLSILLSCAVDWDLVDLNVVKTFRKRMLKEAPPRLIYPSDAEVVRLTSATNVMAQHMIWFLAQTGMRQEEVCSLQWSQVDLDRREVRLYRTKTSTPRIVPLSDEALETLRTTPRHPFGTFVFWHGEGDRYRQFSNRFRQLAQRVSFTHTCHSLRHKFASEFLQRGGDIASLQAILGHKSIMMTMRYSHLQTDRLHEVIRNLRPKSAS